MIHFVHVVLSNMRILLVYSLCIFTEKGRSQRVTILVRLCVTIDPRKGPINPKVSSSGRRTREALLFLVQTVDNALRFKVHLSLHDQRLFLSPIFPAFILEQL